VVDVCNDISADLVQQRTCEELGEEDRVLVEPPTQYSDDEGDIEDGEYWGVRR
jgi:hypothetical protein